MRSNIKDIVSGMRVSKPKFTETSLFKADRTVSNEMPEHNELIFLDSTSDNFGLTETAIIVDNESIAYLISAKSTKYNDELQVSYSSQELTLNGLFYFSKSSSEDDNWKLEVCYDKFLQESGLDCTFNEIIELFELNTEYSVYMLKFETNDSFYTLTAKDGKLKKITRKLIASTPQIKSAFFQS